MTVTLAIEDVRAWARLAGVALPEDQLATIADRLGATLGQLGAVPDEALRDVEPAFVLPLPRK